MRFSERFTLVIVLPVVNTEISVGYSQRNHSGIYIDAMVHFFSEILRSPLFVIILGFTHVTLLLDNRR